MSPTPSESTKLSKFLISQGSNLFGLLLILLISFPILFKPGYVFFTDFVSGPGRDSSLGNFNTLLNLFLQVGNWMGAGDWFSKGIFVFSFGILYFAGRSLARNFTKDEIIASLVGAFSMLNLFIYERSLYGQIGITIGLGMLIFSLSYFIKYWKLEGDKNLNLVLTGLFFGLAIDFAPHYLFIGGLSLLLTYFAFCGKGQAAVSWTKLLAIYILGLAINVYSIAHQFLSSGNLLNTTSRISELDYQAFQTVGTGIFHKLTNVLLLTGFWGREQKRFIDVTDSPLWYLFFLPILAVVILGLWQAYKKDLRVFWLCISSLVLGVLLSVATSLSWLRWLYEIPMYSSLREPQKWVGIVLVTYLIALVYGLAFVKEKVGKLWTIFFFLLFLLAFNFRMLFGFVWQVEPTQYPESWYRINNFFNQALHLQKNAFQKSSCDGVILSLPWHLYLSLPFTQRVVANPSESFFDCPTVSGSNMEYGNIFDSNYSEETSKYGYWIFNNNQSAPPSDLKFILLIKTVDWEKYLWLNERATVEKVEENQDWVLYKVR
jgi:hypothetical protein